MAIGDEVAARLNAQLAVVLIGERPGLSSPDSKGIYMIWQPIQSLHNRPSRLAAHFCD